MNPILGWIIRITLTFLGMVVTLLPRKLELALGPVLGRFYLHVDPKRRRIAYDNIRHCLPELGPKSWDELLKKNYDHYGLLALEILHMFSPIPGHYRNYVQRVSVLEGFENWKRAHGKGKGVLFVGAHIGNWELGAAQGALHGMPLLMVTRHLKPEWLHKKIETSRLSVGARATYLPDTLPSILRGLRKGDSIGFMLDQYAAPPIGIPTPFFGVKVDTLAAVGTFAGRYGAAIVPVIPVREADGIVHLRVEPELDLGPNLSDAEKTTTLLNAKVEAWIRANPAQWLWVHRRFKNVRWPEENIAGSGSR